jgi:hypothetical protein
MSALTSRSFRPAAKPNLKIHMPIGARRDEATPETNSARETRLGFGRR